MKYEIKVRVMATCLGSDKAKNMAANGPIPLPFIIDYDGRNNFNVYMESLDSNNIVGVVSYFNGNIVGPRELRADEDLRKKLIDIANSKYEFRIDGIDDCSTASKTYLHGYIKTDDMSAEKNESGESRRVADAWKKAFALGGPFTKHYHDKVTAAFEKHKVPEPVRFMVVSQYKLPKDRKGNIIPLVEPTEEFFSGGTMNELGVYYNNVFLVVLLQVLNHNPVILQGPKSVGKNFLMEWIAYVIGAVYYEITVHPDMTIYDLLGDKTIDNSAAQELNMHDAESYIKYMEEPDTCYDIDGAVRHEYWSKYNQTMRFTVEETEFKRWARQPEGKRILMINELNYGNPTILAAVFNRVAEDRDVRFIDVPGEERIYFNDDCILTASMNVDYVGTVELNEAMRSRFGVVEMQPVASIKDLLKNKIEVRYGKGFIPDAYFTACNNLYVYMLQRSQGVSGNTALYGDKAISIRGFVRALKDVAFDLQMSENGLIPKKSLCRALNVHLRGLGDTIEEQSAITQDINDKCGNL